MFTSRMRKAYVEGVVVMKRSREAWKENTKRERKGFIHSLDGRTGKQREAWEIGQMVMTIARPSNTKVGFGQMDIHQITASLETGTRSYWPTAIH